MGHDRLHLDGLCHHGWYIEIGTIKTMNEVPGCKGSVIQTTPMAIDLLAEQLILFCIIIICS